jgi:glycerol-3-phosphate dehydrogenase
MAGGKLTGYRKMAERVVDMVVDENFPDRNLKSCYTQEIPITENPFKSHQDVQKYNEEVANRLKAFHLESMAAYLVANYGRQTDEILRGEGTITETSLLRAELKYCLNHEMVVYPEDFLLRRTGMALFDKTRYDKVFADVAKILPSVGHIQ